MSVAIDDDFSIIAFRQFRRSRTSHFMTVAYVKMYSADLDIDPLCQSGLAWRVRIAEDRAYGGDEAELRQNVRPADVSGVKNQLDTLQGFVHAQPNEAVRIGYEPEDMRVGVRHRHFYILRESCRGYDSRCDWGCGPYAARGSHST
jgi:hypothetical protein